MLLPCVFLCFSGSAQIARQLSVSILKESTAFPFTRFLPVHPGGELMLTISRQENQKSISGWNLALGGFHHQKIANAFYLRGEYAYRPIVRSIFTVDLIGYAGYMHTFYPGELYQRNPQNGAFEKIRHAGRPHALAGIGIGLTLVKTKHIQPFIRQEFAIESPFANGIPVMIHSFLKLGLSFSLKPA